MKDDILALELTRLYVQNKKINTSENVIDTYYLFLSEIQERVEDNRIAKIKKIFDENEHKEGSWCNYSGIKMLEEIEKITKGE
jgi:hypothetical protein